MADPKNSKPTAAPRVDANTDKTVAAAVASETAKNPMASQGLGLSSVGADLSDEAPVTKVDGMVAIDAGGPYAAAAPQPTPAEVVLYPATGGLPDTGPNSKYAKKDKRVPEFFNKEGERINRDGQLIDEFGDRIRAKGVDERDEEEKVSPKNLPKRVQEEMEAGKKALGSRAR
jgi:hypothetical protein